MEALSCHRPCKKNLDCRCKVDAKDQETALNMANIKSSRGIVYKLFNADEHKLHHQADGFPAARCVLVSLKEGWAKERTTEYSNLPREGDH